MNRHQWWLGVDQCISWVKILADFLHKASCIVYAKTTFVHFFTGSLQYTRDPSHGNPPTSEPEGLRLMRLGAVHSPAAAPMPKRGVCDLSLLPDSWELVAGRGWGVGQPPLHPLLCGVSTCPWIWSPPWFWLPSESTSFHGWQPGRALDNMGPKLEALLPCAHKHARLSARPPLQRSDPAWIPAAEWGEAQNRLWLNVFFPLSLVKIYQGCCTTAPVTVVAQ